MSTAGALRYGVRRLRPSDRDAYFRLFDRARGVTPSREWFEWKFEENPYLDRTPVFVVERQGELVGATAMWPLRVRLGDETRIAVQPCDTLVRPDCHSRDVVPRLLDGALDACRAGEPAICYDFAGTLDGTNAGAGRTSVARLPTYYRIQDPEPLVDGPPPLAGIADAVAKGYLAACDKIAPETTTLSVDRYDHVPPETFARLYRRQVPEAIHALRDERFYRWRYRNPRREYEAYVARRDGEPVAGAVVSSFRSPRSDHAAADIVDVAPLLADEEATASLLDAVVEAHADADVIAANLSTATHGVLSRFGFHRDDAFPLSRICDRTDFGVYPIVTDDVGPINGFDPTERGDWLTTFAERAGT